MTARGNTEYWVDGYNVIFALRLGEGASLEERRSELVARSATLGRRVWIVFDAAEGRTSPESRVSMRSAGKSIASSRASSSRVRVTFARDGRNADQVLTDKARSGGALIGVVVVTGDRELAGRCSQQGARVIAPAEFARVLIPSRPAPVSSEPRRDRPLSKGEVDEWLRYFGVERKPKPTSSSEPQGREKPKGPATDKRSGDATKKPNRKRR